eukprot:2306807-Rhodomonas_salina.1
MVSFTERRRQHLVPPSLCPCFPLSVWVAGWALLACTSKFNFSTAEAFSLSPSSGRLALKYSSSATSSFSSGDNQGGLKRPLSSAPEKEIMRVRSPVLGLTCKGKAPKVSKKRAPRTPPMTPKSADMSRHITVNLDYPGILFRISLCTHYRMPGTYLEFRAARPQARAPGPACVHCPELFRPSDV